MPTGADRVPRAMAAALLAVVAAGIGAVARDAHARPAPASAAPHTHSRVSPSPSPSPTATSLRDSALAAARHGGFAFLDPPGRNGDVDRWNPCVPVHYVVDIVQGPPSSVADVAWAAGQVSRATGISWTYDGTTRERPSDKRADVARTPAGYRFAPVLVAVLPHRDYVKLAGDAPDDDSDAYTDPDVYQENDTDAAQIVSAQVVLDADHLTDGGHADPHSLGVTLLHEFGHVMGLDHVHARGEVMASDGGGVTAYGPGDLAGLRYVGRDAGCFEDPVLPTDSDDYPGG